MDITRQTTDRRQPPWVKGLLKEDRTPEHLTVQPRLLVPPSVPKMAHLAAIIRALLLEQDLPAWNLYHKQILPIAEQAVELMIERISHASKNSNDPSLIILAISDLAARVPGHRNKVMQQAPDAWLPDKDFVVEPDTPAQEWMGEFISPKVGPEYKTIAIENEIASGQLPAIMDLLQQLRPALEEFADWMYGSQHGLFLLFLLACYDALGVDPIAVAQERLEWNKFWGLTYGPRPSDRSGRKSTAKLRKILKRRGWRQLDDRTLLDGAKMWVRGHHVLHSLAAAVRERHGDEADIGLVNMWTKQLKPYDVAVGKERPTKRWDSVPRTTP